MKIIYPPRLDYWFHRISGSNLKTVFGGIVVLLWLCSPCANADDWLETAPSAQSRHYMVKSDLPKEDAWPLIRHMDATFDTYLAMFSRMPLKVRKRGTMDLYR
ncbi:MAG: hypothetical protein N2C12_15405 [Planctomycetales bacterium]